VIRSNMLGEKNWTDAISKKAWWDSDKKQVFWSVLAMGKLDN